MPGDFILPPIKCGMKTDCAFYLGGLTDGCMSLFLNLYPSPTDTGLQFARKKKKMQKKNG